MLRFPLDSHLLQRLPRHPDWKYERISGEAWLTPRPRPLRFHRTTSEPVQAVAADRVEIRETAGAVDRETIVRLLLDVWCAEDPYRSFDDPESTLRGEIERSLDSPELGVVAVTDEGIIGCALVTVEHSERWLSWLTVAAPARERGVATALLASLVDTLARRGVSTLRSAASPANVPSLRWHLSRGFELSADPLREALRGS